MIQRLPTYGGIRDVLVPLALAAGIIPIAGAMMTAAAWLLP